MGKKTKRKAYTSKGQHSNVSRSTVNAARRDVPQVERALNKIQAWRKGQNPWVTVAGKQSNQPFVKVRANTLWGDPKRSLANIFGKADAE